MKPKIVTIKGKPHLVIISYKEYLDLIEAAKKPTQLQKPRQKHKLQTQRVLVRENCDTPDEVQRRLDKGESPVKAWRLYRDLTQTELANQAGVSNSTISLIENGVRCGTTETLEAIADALNVPTDMLGLARE